MPVTKEWNADHLEGNEHDEIFQLVRAGQTGRFPQALEHRSGWSIHFGGQALFEDRGVLRSLDPVELRVQSNVLRELVLQPALLLNAVDAESLLRVREASQESGWNDVILDVLGHAGITLPRGAQRRPASQARKPADVGRRIHPAPLDLRPWQRRPRCRSCHHERGLPARRAADVPPALLLLRLV